mmetsp:Transcript_2208/g.2945  ORF Transcript_2208/g.2945 Transcript_2208/m.2945 type:complete len:289 (+) Transcript_2208:96-962(+)
MGGGDSGSGGAFKNIMSGTVAGVAQVVAGHPLDTIKVRLQTQSSTNPEFSGMADCIKKTIQGEGLMGLYAGAASPLLGAMAHNAGVFFSYGLAKDFVGQGKELTIPQYYAAGSLAAVPISLVESPVDFFKIQLQAQVGEGKYSGVFDCAKQVYASQGIKGVYQGFVASLMRNVPCFGAYFFSFEATKAALTKKGEDPSLGTCFVAGGAAGFGFWGIWYPLETMKTRIQSDNPDPKLRNYKGILDCFGKTYAENGLKSFYKGYLPSIARAVPVNAAIFTGFTAAKKALG